MKVSERLLNTIIRQIVALVAPRRIILFGSAARGDMRKNSDIDLMIVLPDRAAKKKSARILYTALETEGVPFDIVPVTEEDLARHGDTPGLVYRSALREGRVLYAA